MPDVDAHAAIRAIGCLDDRQRVSGVDDVREREELEADDRSVIGGAVAHVTEAGGRIGDRPLVRADRLDVPTLERVDELPHDVLESPVVGARCCGPPAGQHLDLGEAHVGGVEHLAELLDREPGLAQPHELPGVQPDAGEACVGGGPDPVIDRMVAVETEVTQHEVVAAECPWRDHQVRAFTNRPASSARS